MTGKRKGYAMSGGYLHNENDWRFSRTASTEGWEEREPPVFINPWPRLIVGLLVALMLVAVFM